MKLSKVILVLPASIIFVALLATPATQSYFKNLAPEVEFSDTPRHSVQQPYRSRRFFNNRWTRDRENRKVYREAPPVQNLPKPIPYVGNQ